MAGSGSTTSVTVAKVPIKGEQVAIVVISIIYLLAVILLGGVPAASDFSGHTLGVVGFLLMLMTEMLYTLRKRSRSARWGRVSSWLQFHIVTGLVSYYTPPGNSTAWLAS